ncbi:MAG TPA: PAS domain-containing protein, partial [Azonexus sp.]|nr:PAS domain-containing protein [Azonexus sp.]
IVGNCVLDGFSEQTLWFFRDHYLAAVNSLQARKYSCQVVTPGGRLTWQAGWLTPLLEDDEFSGMVCTVEDITLPKRARSLLESSEARFQAIFENVEQLAIQGYTSDGTVIYWNPASEKIYGYSASEAIGRSLYDLIVPPEAADAVKDAVNWMFQHKKGIPATRLELLHKDGHSVPVFSSHAVADTPGHGATLFCLDINLAELEFAQRALHQSQQMLRHLTDQLPGAVYQLRRSPDGRMAMPYASAGFYTMYELKPEEVREDISALGTRWHPDDAEGMRRTIAESARTLQPWIHEYRVNLPGKGTEWRLSHARPEAEPDGSVLWHGFITDITAKRRVELALRESEVNFRRKSQHLADVIWGTNSGTWEWNLLTGEATFNECWAEIAGYKLSGLGTLSIDTWRNLTHPDDLKESEQRLRRYFAQESQFFESETRIRHKNGEWVWVLDRGRVVEWTAGGNPLRMSGTRKDITARKQAEEELKAAIAKAEQASNAKSRFLAAISHDLRQPLAALSLYVDVLKSKVAPTDRPLLNNMVNCVSSLSELLTDLLDVSKLDAGIVVPEISNFSVAELLDEQISAHGPEALLKGLSLRCISGRQKTRTDPLLFKRMLGALIANAIRFTQSGGVLVGCRQRQGKTWIEVWDTGIGIPADKTEEIFEEFRQLDHEERNRGSGLGLAIVAKTASLLGLQIRVQSRPGRGSMFALELPLSVEETITAQTGSKSGLLRIALVDDNRSVLTAMVCALEAMGHEVVAATAGSELLAQLGSLPPDVVISDFRLSEGQTGFDVIAAVRASFNAMLPALIVTGDSDPQLMRSMADRGIVVQHKPLEFEALQTCIAQLVKP